MWILDILKGKVDYNLIYDRIYVLDGATKPETIMLLVQHGFDLTRNFRALLSWKTHNQRNRVLIQATVKIGTIIRSR